MVTKNIFLKPKKNKKVIVALSGGIDSGVAAFLLTELGYKVEGVFMRMYDGFQESEKRARRIAQTLKIPFFIIDLRKKFKTKIIDYFLNSYQKGITPNPCVFCNREIKFDSLLEIKKKRKADFIATGHYVRLVALEEEGFGSEIFGLLRGKDKNKDQSYFLWQLKQIHLRYSLFPLGNYLKEEVKKIAKSFKIFPVADISESQEVCFVKNTNDSFLKENLGEKPGLIIDKAGNKVGEHQGLWFYTIGQRRKIGLSGGPYWVLDKDLKKNHLIVTKKEKDLYKQGLVIKKVNWLRGKEPDLPIKAKIQIRYRQKPSLGEIKKENQKIKITFLEKQKAITPGQSAVFYSFQNKKSQEEELLGGGIIEKAF